MEMYYRTEEQQIDLIREFWKKNGRLILTTLAVVALLIGGYRYLQHHKTVRSAQASKLYAEMLISMQQQDLKSVQTQGEHLQKEFGKIAPYPSLAALLMGKLAIDEGDLEKAAKHFQWVVDHDSKSPFLHVARVRLARVYQAQGRTEEALKLLGKPADNYVALYEEIKGDILVGNQQFEAAKEAYESALQHLPSDLFRSYLELKLRDLPVDASSSAAPSNSTGSETPTSQETSNEN